MGDVAVIHGPRISDREIAAITLSNRRIIQESMAIPLITAVVNLSG